MSPISIDLTTPVVLRIALLERWIEPGRFYSNPCQGGDDKHSGSVVEKDRTHRHVSTAHTYQAEFAGAIVFVNEIFPLSEIRHQPHRGNEFERFQIKHLHGHAPGLMIPINHVQGDLKFAVCVQFDIKNCCHFRPIGSSCNETESTGRVWLGTGGKSPRIASRGGPLSSTRHVRCHQRNIAGWSSFVLILTSMVE